jgi:SAM-dependent methyltransferase
MEKTQDGLEAERDDSKTKQAEPHSASPSREIVMLAPFNPTCLDAQSMALHLLQLRNDDVLFDLGCGDAQLLLLAARSAEGIRCVGMEIDPVFVDRAKSAIAKLPIPEQRRIQIRQGDVLQLVELNAENSGETNNTPDARCNDQTEEIGRDCRELTLSKDASALYLYLLPKGLVRIKPLLDRIVEARQREHPTTERAMVFRVVTYMFQIHGWTPATVDRSTKGGSPLYLYQFYNVEI